jgi:hypothetical protein
MEANFYVQETLIGTVTLRVIDGSMGVIGGTLIPTDAYSPFRSIFRESEGKYTVQLVSLRLNLQLSNGCFIYPIGGFSIIDIPEFSDEITLDILGVCRYIMADYFESPEKPGFLEEPWETISVTQKILLENELAAEIGTSNGASTSPHILTTYKYSALGRCSTNDDVLFAIHHPTADFQFAVVHLTWRGNTENNSRWPITSFYVDFEEFRRTVMLRDKADWEQ